MTTTIIFFKLGALYRTYSKTTAPVQLMFYLSLIALTIQSYIVLYISLITNFFLKFDTYLLQKLSILYEHIFLWQMLS